MVIFGFSNCGWDALMRELDLVKYQSAKSIVKKILIQKAVGLKSINYWLTQISLWLDPLI